MKVFLIVLVLLALVLFLPLLALAAPPNQDVLNVLKEVVKGILEAGKQAYCGIGVTFYCQ